jgi:uncharacterized protein (DUF362 family)
MKPFDKGADTHSTAAIAENADPSRTGEAIRRVVELTGGMDWLEPGQTVVIKPSLNSAGKFPFTSSPASCAELVRMCLEKGAAKVYIADEMGFEHTMTKHWKTGKFEGFDKDHTIHSFKKTGIYDAVIKVGDELDASDRIHITTFREEGWRRHEFLDGLDEESPNGTTLHSKWVQRQLKQAEKWSGDKARRMYIPRHFDLRIKKAKPGMFVPNLLDKVDHIINVFRLSSHVWSQYTMAIKNWVGIMRPDDRVWMHQLNYLKNNRHAANGLDKDDPIRTEPLYHEQLADLHLAHTEKERLCVADATQVILTGGPDGTDRPFCRANLVLAARDIIAADIVSLAVLRYGTMKAPDGLGGQYEPQPAGWMEAVSGLVKDLKWPEGKNVFRGTDAKLCDPEFSNWDWVAVQRARELGLGARGPDDLHLVFDEKDSPFAVSAEKRDWITEDALRAPKCKLNGFNKE